MEVSFDVAEALAMVFVRCVDVSDHYQHQWQLTWSNLELINNTILISDKSI